MTEGDFHISVIIPTYNRSDILEKCLRALNAQTLPGDRFELIVVDDGSQDTTPEVAVRFQKETFGSRLTFLRQRNSGQNAARNRAIAVARGKLLLFINDDTIAAPTMLAEHGRVHEAHPEETVAVLGRVTRSRDIPWNIFATLHLDETFAQWEGRTELDWRSFITCNLSVKRSFLLKYGTYDESLRYNDDVELGERLSHHGLRILYHPDSLGYHDHYLTEEDFLGIAKKSGASLAVWHKRAPHLGRELAGLGFYLGNPWPARLKYLLADLVFFPAARPFWLFWARFFTDRWEGAALALYRKLYKASEREHIRRELARK
ncbi:MAG: glycosyltransferase family A protein [Pseudomonadota bacterium]|nr:glycosyltransferase family A protein [Pseudomonadota bacterium]